MNLCRDCEHPTVDPLRFPAKCKAAGPVMNFVTGVEELLTCEHLRDVFGAECPHFKDPDA